MSFTNRIRPAVQLELRQARLLEAQGQPSGAFQHLERAHVLGQASTREHLRVHLAMLCWGWRQKNWAEIRGQIVRLLGAAAKTFVGLVPAGNTGGSNVSPFRAMPVSPDLQQQIEQSKQQ